MPSPAMDPRGELSDDARLLLRLGEGAGGRVDPARIKHRDSNRPARRAFDELCAKGCLDDAGWITQNGYDALEGVRA